MPIFNNPYPLLDNEKGNFEDSSFDCELVESKIENGIYFFHFKADIEDDVLNNLIDEGIVSFAIKVESRPYFLDFFKADSNNKFEITVELDYKEVSSDFSFDFTPVLISNIAFKYRNENANPPLCEYDFDLNANQIVGSYSTVRLGFDRVYRTIDAGPLIRIVRLQPPKKPIAGTMDINLNDMDQIKVFLSDVTYEKFLEVNRRDPKLLDALVTLPVLQYALTALLDKTSDLHELEWAKLLDADFQISEMNNQEDVLKKCDDILNSSIPSFINHYLKKYDTN